MQQQNFKVASQPSRHDLSTNSTYFSIGLDLGMISFARAIFLCFFHRIWLIFNYVTWPWNLDTRLGLFAKAQLQSPPSQQNYSFYSISLSSAAMSLQIQGDIRRSKRKLSAILDLPDFSSFSQNPSISTPAEKKKKVSSFSQSQSTRYIQDIPIYSESPLSEDSESAIKTQKSQVFVKIPKKTSFDFL